MDAKKILEQVAKGDLSIEKAELELQQPRQVSTEFADVDVDRLKRCGLPEVIFTPGKTPEQVIGIMSTLRDARQNVFATRASPELYEAVSQEHPDAIFHDLARVITIEVEERPAAVGLVSVVCAGTSDIPVAEEAAITAEWMGARIARVRDVGVAGLHRLEKHIDSIRQARAVVVVAGMEGALPSVVGGLVDRPVIAVPTSIGYGLNLEGVSTLLAMLNTCVAGITVVNVDNGFGAGVAAALINRVGE